MRMLMFFSRCMEILCCGMGICGNIQNGLMLSKWDIQNFSSIYRFNIIQEDK